MLFASLSVLTIGTRGEKGGRTALKTTHISPPFTPLSITLISLQKPIETRSLPFENRGIWIGNLILPTSSRLEYVIFRKKTTFCCLFLGYNCLLQYTGRNLGLRRFVQNFDLNASWSWYNVKMVGTAITRIANYELSYCSSNVLTRVNSG